MNNLETTGKKATLQNQLRMYFHNAEEDSKSYYFEIPCSMESGNGGMTTRNSNSITGSGGPETRKFLNKKKESKDLNNAYKIAPFDILTRVRYHSILLLICSIN